MTAAGHRSPRYRLEPLPLRGDADRLGACPVADVQADTEAARGHRSDALGKRAPTDVVADVAPVSVAVEPRDGREEERAPKASSLLLVHDVLEQLVARTGIPQPKAHGVPNRPGRVRDRASGLAPSAHVRQSELHGMPRRARVDRTVDVVGEHEDAAFSGRQRTRAGGAGAQRRPGAEMQQVRVDDGHLAHAERLLCRGVGPQALMLVVRLDRALRVSLVGQPEAKGREQVEGELAGRRPGYAGTRCVGEPRNCLQRVRGCARDAETAGPRWVLAVVHVDRPARVAGRGDEAQAGRARDQVCCVVDERARNVGNEGELSAGHWSSSYENESSIGRCR